MRVLAILAAYNEERFIAACLEHLFRQGVEAYLIDNASSDQTAAIASRYLGHGLIGIEQFPRAGIYSWKPILRRKEQLATNLEADWFIHIDPDEFRLSPSSGSSLAQALDDVDRQGYNAVNFSEFAFVPTREAPDHDHRDFQKTMRWYYPFRPSAAPHRLNAWRRQDEPVELAWSGGHQVRFSGLRPYPESFPMRHYLFLSIPHAVRKYLERTYDPSEVANGWHRARAQLRLEMIKLPAQAELRPYLGDDLLDASTPRTRHFLFDKTWASMQTS
jgi:hypothetical protein